MQPENLHELISLKLSGEARPEDLKALNEYLSAHPEAQSYVAQLETIWKETRVQVPLDSKTAFEKHIKKLDRNKLAPVIEPNRPRVFHIQRNYLRRVIAVAASVLLVFLSVVYFTGKNDTSESKELNFISTKYGSKKKLQLPDGTQVWLNSGSSISFNKNFSKSHREIELTGEAFFDVVEDKEHPFLIHTKLMDVKVLGTAFNVRSYPNEQTSEAALIRGRVQIILHQNPGETLFLKPNEKIIINNSTIKEPNGSKEVDGSPRIILTQIHRLKEENTSIETSWVNNTLAFDNETLEQIALKLERWFDVKVIITEDALKPVTYYGVFDDENLEEVLTALKITGNFQFKINSLKKEVILTP